MRVVLIGIVVVGSAVTMGLVVLGISIGAGVSSVVGDEVVVFIVGSVSESIGSGVGVGSILIGVADSVGIVSGVGMGFVELDMTPKTIGLLNQCLNGSPNQLPTKLHNQCLNQLPNQCPK